MMGLIALCVDIHLPLTVKGTKAFPARGDKHRLPRLVLHAYSWRPNPDGASRLAQLRWEHLHNRGLAPDYVFTNSAHGPINLWFISPVFILGSPATSNSCGICGRSCLTWRGVHCRWSAPHFREDINLFHSPESIPSHSCWNTWMCTQLFLCGTSVERGLALSSCSCSQGLQMLAFRLGGAELTVGLDDLKHLFQPEHLHDSKYSASLHANKKCASCSTVTTTGFTERCQWCHPSSGGLPS